MSLTKYPLLAFSLFASTFAAYGVAAAKPADRHSRYEHRERYENPYTNASQQRMRREREIARQIERDRQPGYYRFKGQRREED